MWTRDSIKVDTLTVANAPNEGDLHVAVSNGSRQRSHRVPKDSLNADDNNVDDDKANGASLHHTDPAIKLFGRAIPVASRPMKTVKYEQEQAGQGPVSLISDVQFHNKQELGVEASSTEDIGNGLLASDDLGSSSSNDGNEEGKLHEAIRDSQATSGTENGILKEDNAHGHVTHDKMFKKPEKLLPCPRCNSLDTKFCYFNNYNVNQPRHFCKNCQRYWTAGGTLRNVPIGAGRRKSKHSVTHLKHMMHDFTAVRPDPNVSAHCKSSCSDDSRGNRLKIRSQPSRLQVLPLEASSLTTLENPKTTATSSFWQEGPICEIMAATTLNKHTSSGIQTSAGAQGWSNPAGVEEAKDGNPAAKPDERTNLQSNSLCVFNSNRDSQTASASITDAVDEEHTGVGVVAEKAENASLEKVPSFSNSGGLQQSHLNMKWIVTKEYAECSSDASGALAPNSVTSNASPGGLWAGFPWPPMHASLWGPPPSECGSFWNMPWGVAPAMAVATSSAAAAAAAAAATSSSVTNTNTTTRRKHWLDGSHAEPCNDGCLLVPKTLRINDPVEAARSSIWRTLGLEDAPGPQKICCATAFHPKSETRVFEETSVQAYHTNPAALSRSMAFQESS